MKRPFKCPICNGTGKVSRPLDIAGDLPWSGVESGPWPCTCQGGIVWGPPEIVVEIQDKDGDPAAFWNKEDEET
jgi:hypothetical protein